MYSPIPASNASFVTLGASPGGQAQGVRASSSVPLLGSSCALHIHASTFETVSTSCVVHAFSGAIEAESVYGHEDAVHEMSMT